MGLQSLEKFPVAKFSQRNWKPKLSLREQTVQAKISCVQPHTSKSILHSNHYCRNRVYHFTLVPLGTCCSLLWDMNHVGTHACTVMEVRASQELRKQPWPMGDRSRWINNPPFISRVDNSKVHSTKLLRNTGLNSIYPLKMNPGIGFPSFSTSLFSTLHSSSDSLALTFLLGQLLLVPASPQKKTLCKG